MTKSDPNTSRTKEVADLFIKAVALISAPALGIGYIVSKLELLSGVFAVVFFVIAVFVLIVSTWYATVLIQKAVTIAEPDWRRTYLGRLMGDFLPRTFIVFCVVLIIGLGFFALYDAVISGS